MAEAARISQVVVETAIPTSAEVRTSQFIIEYIRVVTVIVVPTFETETQRIVRVRRAPHLADEQQVIFYTTFQLDIEAGVGTTTGQGSDPELLMRISKDGGFTWSAYQNLGVGAQGQYRYRCIARRLGRGRDVVIEVRQSDPVKTVWLDAYLGLSEGTS